MLIDKTHLGWGLATAAALGVATAGYAFSVAGPRVASGGSVAGLTFGMLSLAAMILAGLLAVRKKFPATRLGSAQFWLRMHIWLGLLSVPLALFHSGFRFGGTLEKVFMAVFFVVILSGVYGLALQQVLPRFLKVRVPLETFPQQIPYLCGKLRDEAEQLLKDLEGPAKKTAPAAKAEAAFPPAEKPPAVVAAASKKPAPAAKSALAAKLAAAAKKPAAASAPDAATAVENPASAPAPPTDKPAPAAKSALAAKLAAAKKPAATTPATESPAEAPKPVVEKPTVKDPAAKPNFANLGTLSTLGSTLPPGGAMPRLALFASFCRDEVYPFLDSDPRAASRQNLTSENFARMAFANLAVALPSQALPAIHRLDEIVAERRQFLVQVRIQNWLRSWLLVHVPLSAALFALAAVHILAALRVVPWP